VSRDKRKTEKKHSRREKNSSDGKK